MEEGQENRYETAGLGEVVCCGWEGGEKNINNYKPLYSFVRVTIRPKHQQYVLHRSNILRVFWILIFLYLRQEGERNIRQTCYSHRDLSSYHASLYIEKKH